MLTVADMQELAYLPLDQGQINDPGINAGVATTGTYGFTTDRFGSVNAAAHFSDDTDRFDVTDMFTARSFRARVLQGPKQLELIPEGMQMVMRQRPEEVINHTRCQQMVTPCDIRSSPAWRRPWPWAEIELEVTVAGVPAQ
jgi:hypothetical protein